MKLFYPFGLICLLNIFCLNAQTNAEDFEKKFTITEEAFSKVYQNGKSESVTYAKGGYAEIIPELLILYKQDSSNMNLAFKLGVCYRNSRTARIQAIPYFRKASTSVSDKYKGSSYKEKNAPLITFQYLGDAYHLNYEFDKAIAAYEKFIAVMAENNSTDKTLLAETNRKIEMCKTGKQLMAQPIKVKIKNLGSNVNSAYADYAPVISADQNYLFFTSRR